MAVTKGHGNPNWARDEVILALELYNKLGGVIPGPNDERVISLSKELRSLPYHLEASKVASFRNPAGVAFKLQNLRQVDGGKGLSHTAKTDREVWEAYGNDPGATVSAAARIRSGVSITRADEPPDEDFEFAEGRAVTEAHKRLERNRSIRRKLLKARKSVGKLHCEICACAGTEYDTAVRESIFEAHHTRPISQTGEVKTRMSDMALLCANCHRLVHRLMAIHRRWIDIPEAKSVLASNSP